MINIFISYSHKDEEFRAELQKHLITLHKSGLANSWYDRCIEAGQELDKEIKENLAKSQIILLLISPDFISSNYCYEIEMKTALEMHKRDKARVIPVILRHCDWLSTPIANLMAVPKDGVPIKKFPDRDEGFYEASQEIKRVVASFTQNLTKPDLKIDSKVSIKGVESSSKTGLAEAKVDNSDLPSMPNLSPAAFFEKRFGEAFPGIREITWFDKPSEIVERLSILLREPLAFRENTPIWWWRDGDLPISSFKAIHDETVLIDILELKVKRMAAVYLGSYYKHFVYLEFSPSQPTGLYERDIQEAVRRQGYCNEEYGVYKDHFISRAEYDDNAAIINGKPILLNGEAELRVRYTTPYNLLIASVMSPINSNKFYDLRAKMLNEILQGKTTIDELAEIVKKLPKREY